MEEFFVFITVVSIVIGLPWLIFHYVTKWKQAPKITVEDEQLLDDMFVLARRLEERLVTIERIVAADNPDWKPRLGSPASDWQGAGLPSQGSYSNTFPVERRN